MLNDLRFRQMASEGILCTQRIKRRGEKGDYSIPSLRLGRYKITLACQVALDMNLSCIKINIIPRQRRNLTVTGAGTDGELPHVFVLTRQGQHHRGVLITL